MYEEATTSGVFNPSIAESFEQIALVGEFKYHKSLLKCALHTSLLQS